jgi:hypothetical protein
MSISVERKRGKYLVVHMLICEYLPASLEILKKFLNGGIISIQKNSIREHLIRPNHKNFMIRVRSKCLASIHPS